MQSNERELHKVDDEYINLGYIGIAIIIGILNSFYYDNIVIMTGLCVAEVIILIGCLFKKEKVTYLCFYLLFVTFSMESETFVGTSDFYGFKNFRVGGLNLAVWMLFPLMFDTIINLNNLFLKVGSFHKSLLKKIILFTFGGVLIGLFSYLSGDNGFGRTSGSGSQFLETYYVYLLPFVEIIAFSWVVSAYKEYLPKLKKYMFSTIVALAVVFVVCFITKNYGNRGGLESLQVSEIYFLLVCSIVLLVYNQFNVKSKIVLGISSVIIMVLSLMYNASGKIVIMAVLIPLLMLIIMKRKGSATKMIIGVVATVILLSVISQFLLPRLMTDSKLLTSKYQQTIQLFSVSNSNWFDSIPASPKMRITEFLNISNELFEKPWFLPFGKGFCGTIKDGLGLFTDLNEFAFSEWELRLGAYYSMHESINSFFLVGGIWGLYVILSIVIGLFRRVHESPWLVFGFMWILLFYNYHLTVSVYGIVALIVGLEDIRCHDCDHILV